jgi:hypothetical protein
MDAVCGLIRNAVPPLYAKLAGREVLAAVTMHSHQKRRKSR